jgi:hypothetical protein
LNAWRRRCGRARRCLQRHKGRLRHLRLLWPRRTPPLPQPPQPPMQPLQPPTLMQLPLPGLPPSAAAAPPVPEAPRVLSAKALGKRKIGSR